MVQFSHGYESPIQIRSLVDGGVTSTSIDAKTSVLIIPQNGSGSQSKKKNTGSFPTISHHLRILRDAGLIDGRKKQLYSYYFLRRERLAQIQAQVQALTGGAL